MNFHLIIETRGGILEIRWQLMISSFLRHHYWPSLKVFAVQGLLRCSSIKTGDTVVFYWARGSIDVRDKMHDVAWHYGWISWASRTGLHSFILPSLLGHNSFYFRPLCFCLFVYLSQRFLAWLSSINSSVTLKPIIYMYYIIYMYIIRRHIHVYVCVILSFAGSLN